MKQKILSALVISALLFVPILSVSAADTKDGFTRIFNGTDLSGWTGNPELWSVKDGAIVGQTTAEHPTKGNTFLIWTNGELADFELRLSFKIASGNSGIQYRSKVVDEKNWVVGGYQADLEAGATYTGILYDERGVAGGRNVMAARGEKVVWDKDCKKQVTGKLEGAEEAQASIVEGHWSEYAVIVKGNHLQHFINGHQTVDVTDECETKALKSGVLALQLHAGPPMTVQFKNIRIKTAASGVQSAAEEIKWLNGTWEIGASEANGSAIPADDSAGITVKIDGGTYSVTKNGGTNQGTFSFDASKTPKQMDIRPQTGPGAGVKIPAIYELSADTLRVCYATEAGTDRPKAFTTAPDSGQVLITYKRKK